jgi:hypothetical protein
VNEEQALKELAKAAAQHPVAMAMVAVRLKGGDPLERSGPPRPLVPRGHKGQFLKGHSGNPSGAPRGRARLRQMFHAFGVDAVAKLSALVDDHSISPSERAAILVQCINLSCSVRAIRSDARSRLKAEQLRREQELHAAKLAVFQRAGVPRNEWPDPPAADPATGDPDWLRWTSPVPSRVPQRRQYRAKD